MPHLIVEMAAGRSDIAVTLMDVLALDTGALSAAAEDVPAQNQTQPTRSTQPS